MGYTHYWYQKRPFTPAEWGQISTEARRVFKAARALKLRGADGTGQPEITPDHLCFNGNAAKGEDYETFYLERVPERRYPGIDREAKEGIFSFCKTEYRPYDAVVVTLLHYLQHLAPDAVTVSSDGGPAAITPKY